MQLRVRRLTGLRSATLYKEAGAIERTIPAEQVIDASILEDAKLKAKWKDSKNEYGDTCQMTDTARQQLAGRRDENAVVTMLVYFEASSERFDRETAEVRAALEGFTDPLTSGIAELEKRRGENRQVARVIKARQQRLAAFSRSRAARRPLPDDLAVDDGARGRRHHCRRRQQGEGAAQPGLRHRRPDPGHLGQHVRDCRD
jgi:hypothetical protein